MSILLSAFLVMTPPPSDTNNSVTTQNNEDVHCKWQWTRGSRISKRVCAATEEDRFRAAEIRMQISSIYHPTLGRN